MSTQLRIEQTVTLIESTPPSSTRLLADMTIVDCTSRECGLKSLPASTSNVSIAEDVTYVTISATDEVQIQIVEHSSGNTIGTVTSRTFSYLNPDIPVDVAISNNNAQVVDVKYVTASVS